MRKPVIVIDLLALLTYQGNTADVWIACAGKQQRNMRAWSWSAAGTTEWPVLQWRHRGSAP